MCTTDEIDVEGNAFCTDDESDKVLRPYLREHDAILDAELDAEMRAEMNARLSAEMDARMDEDYITSLTQAVQEGKVSSEALALIIALRSCS